LRDRDRGRRGRRRPRHRAAHLPEPPLDRRRRARRAQGVSRMWFFDNVWIIPALMGLSFVSILLFGKRLPRKGSEIGIVFVAAAFVLALLTAGSWISRVDSHGDEAAFADVPAHCSAVAASSSDHAAEG